MKPWSRRDKLIMARQSRKSTHRHEVACLNADACGTRNVMEVGNSDRSLHKKGEVRRRVWLAARRVRAVPNSWRHYRAWNQDSGTPMIFQYGITLTVI